MKRTYLLITLVIALFVMPFFIDHGGEYGGSDDQAEAQILQIAPHYQPWFESIYEPASGEIESLLFTLQGCLGTAVIFYVLGYYRRGRNENAES